MKESYYFAYGSNMNLDQMAYRCPAASVVEKVKLEGYRLTFCGRGTFMKGIPTCMGRRLFLFRERMV